MTLVALSLLAACHDDSPDEAACPPRTREPLDERPCGGALQCVCDGEGRLLRSEEPAAGRHSLRRRYRYEDGRLKRVEERGAGPDGTIELRYDDRGMRVRRQTERIDATGHPMLIDTTYEYEGDRLVREHTTATSSLHVDHDIRYQWEEDRLRARRIDQRRIDQRRDGDEDFVESFEYQDDVLRRTVMRDKKGQVVRTCRFTHCVPPHRGCPRECRVDAERFEPNQLRF